MRRALLTVLLVLVVAPPAARADDGGTAKARLTQCRPALDRLERAADFTADMRAIPGAAKLQVKFVLQARTEDEPGWAAVAAPGFGTWNSSATGIGRYVYTKKVENLLAPATYRSQVHFRWLSATGRTLLRVKRTTKVCRQPDLRPDLLPDWLERAGEAWEILVENAGRTAAYSFTVTVESGGQVYPFGYVEELGPRSEVRLQGQAPPCEPGTSVIVRVDADNAVDELDEESNALPQACPR